MPTKDGKRLKDSVLATAEKVEENDTTGDEWEAVSRTQSVNISSSTLISFLSASQIMVIDPGQFKVLNELLQNDAALKGKGRVETLSMAAGAGEDI